MATDFQGVVDERYRLIRRIREGRTGPMWEAEDLRWPGSRVQLQFLADPAHTDGGIPNGFLEDLERLVWPRFGHPNLIKVFGVGRHGSCGFIVTELARGQSLSARLHAGPLEHHVAVRVAAAVAEATEAAREVGVPLGGMSAQDVVLTPTGSVKLGYSGLPVVPGREGPIDGALRNQPDQSVSSPLSVLLADLLEERQARDSAVADVAPELQTGLESGGPIETVISEGPARMRSDPSGAGSRIHAHALRWQDPTPPVGSAAPPGRLQRWVVALAGVGIALVAGVAAAALLSGSDRNLDSPGGQAIAPPGPPSVSPHVVLSQPGVTRARKPTVPDVVGLTVLEARDLLLESDLSIAQTVPTPGQPGVVARTDPRAGARVEPGTNVTLFVGTSSDRREDSATSGG